MFLLTLLIFFTTNRATGFSNDGSLTHSRGYTLSSHVVRDISAGLNIDCSTCPETRTVPQLLWTCASTLILATWVSVHPNVPPRGASMLRAATLRVGAMLMTILAPEMTLVWAFQEWWWAREVLRRVKENYSGWTMTHSFYLVMGGFASFDDNGELKALTPTRFLQHLSSSTFDTPFQFPIISEEDILDKSKGDGLTKAIALFQILWFSIQFVARLAKGWATSELEVLTFATCIIALGIFVLWWSKPLDVKCQTIVKLRPSVEKAEDENEGRGTKADTLAIVEGKPPLTERPPSSVYHSVFTSDPTPVQVFHQRLFKPRPLHIRVFQILLFPFIFIWEMSKAEEDEWADCAPPIGTRRTADNEDNLVLIVACTLFGALHFIAWSFDMASRPESLLWRIASVALTAIPTLCLVVEVVNHFIQRMIWGMGTDSGSDASSVTFDSPMRTVWSLVDWTCTVLLVLLIAAHPVIRLLVAVDALVLLRNLPDGVLLDFEWSGVLPSL